MSENVTLEKREGWDLKNILWERLKWLGYIVLLGSISSSVLMGVSSLIPLDEEGVDQETKLLILNALDMEYTTENVEQVFAENIVLEELEGLTLYRNSEGSIAFEFTGRGHQGPISGLVALGPDLGSVKGLVILEQQETPGLGGRITEEEFLDQFRGVALDPELVILPAGREPTAANEVDGITGATRTSQALEEMLDQSIREVVQRLEGN